MAKPLDKEIAVFVKFHLFDKHAFAPFTGQDYSAWCAFLYACQLYGRSDLNGQAQAIDAMRACVRACQPKEDVLAIFKKSIPGVLDWDFEASIWVQIFPRKHAGDTTWIMPCSNGARICGHIHSKPSKKHEYYFKCKDCDAEWRPADEEARAL